MCWKEGTWQAVAYACIKSTHRITNELYRRYMSPCYHQSSRVPCMRLSLSIWNSNQCRLGLIKISRYPSIHNRSYKNTNKIIFRETAEKTIFPAVEVSPAADESNAPYCHGINDKFDMHYTTNVIKSRSIHRSISTIVNPVFMARIDTKNPAKTT